MYKHALGPAEGNGKGNVLWGFDFKILPIGVYGADCDGLKHTQEAGGADGDTPAHSLNIQNKFACKITGKIFQPQSCNCLRDSFQENDQKVGNRPVLTNQICDPHPSLSVVKKGNGTEGRNCPRFQAHSVARILFL